MEYLIGIPCLIILQFAVYILLEEYFSDRKAIRMFGLIAPALYLTPEITSLVILVKKKRTEKTQNEKFYEPQICSLIEILMGCLGAGLPISDALGFAYSKRSWVPSIDSALKTICHGRERGMSVRQCFEAATLNLATFGPDRFLRQLLHSLMIGHEMGGNLTNLLKKIQVKTQDSMELQRKISVSTAQMRMQAWVVALAPLALALILLVISPEHVLFFFKSMVGFAILLMMIFLNVVGAIILVKINTLDEIC